MNECIFHLFFIKTLLYCIIVWIVAMIYHRVETQSQYTRRCQWLMLLKAALLGMKLVNSLRWMWELWEKRRIWRDLNEKLFIANGPKIMMTEWKYIFVNQPAMGFRASRHNKKGQYKKPRIYFMSRTVSYLCCAVSKWWWFVITLC